MRWFKLGARQEDRLIALVGLCVGLLLTVFGGYGKDAPVPPWLMMVPVAGMAVLELGRRTHTVWTVSLGGLFFIANTFVGTNLATMVMYTDLLYAGVLYGSRRMSTILHLTGGATTLGLSSFMLMYGTVGQALLVAAFSVLIFLVPVWTADLLRASRERADTERLRAEQTALLAELDRREAVIEERSRMARELHDVVANHLSAIAIHATGAQSLAKRQQRDEGDPLLAAMAVIRDNSVQGLAEMRRMIGLLRARDESSYTAPRLDALDTLLTQLSAAGSGTGLSFEAAEQGERGELPAPVELAAYRIVQESLTNALKYAAPGVVSLALTYRQDDIAIAVDSPYGVAGGTKLPGSRTGLVGMGERAELLGGSFSAGADGAWWRVRAQLPREPRETGPKPVGSVREKVLGERIVGEFR
ncbi:Putative two-component system sensor kinase [Kitasatospora sp. MMS16-BH015]|uniref:sensor histidine kinase n=1 Tax=Kitasatospora sp. MMS16-BH015 TaxID=2018025 RepID=UPI000CA3507C|nr:histidine kinase [Kitasatospora sp. MMS16-BH015]AUG79695.1 Putative two-component system sensor kinase [Kitasatospora sp. MMS16-BH015]